jgi:peptidoglycan/LPS O-acetylase OafA/YrhL
VPTPPRRSRFAIALVAWSFFVWTTRIANIWRDDALDTGGKVGRTALALSFTVLALAVVVALWRARRFTAPAVAALAVWTVAVWVVRDVGIVTGDHEAGFKVVHTVLAVISIALAALAWRETRSPSSGPAGRAGRGRRRRPLAGSTSRP